MSKHISLLPSRSVTRVGTNAAGLLLQTTKSVVKRSINKSANNLLPVPFESVTSFPTGYYVPAVGGLCVVGGAYWAYQKWSTPIITSESTKLVVNDDPAPVPSPSLETWLREKWQQIPDMLGEVLGTTVFLFLYFADGPIGGGGDVGGDDDRAFWDKYGKDNAEKRLLRYEQSRSTAQSAARFGGSFGVAPGTWPASSPTSYSQNVPMMWHEGTSLSNPEKSVWSLEDDDAYYRLTDNVSTTIKSTIPSGRQTDQMNDGVRVFPHYSSTLHKPFSYDNDPAIGSIIPQPSYPIRAPHHQSEPSYSSGSSSLHVQTSSMLQPSQYSAYQDFPNSLPSPGPSTSSTVLTGAQLLREHPYALHQTNDSPETESSDEEDAESAPDTDSGTSWEDLHRKIRYGYTNSQLLG